MLPYYLLHRQHRQRFPLLHRRLKTAPEMLEALPLPIQCRLTVGAVDDPLEQEADDMAGRVMRMPEPAFIQRKCAHCQEEEKAQRKPMPTFIQRPARYPAAGSAANAHTSHAAR